MTESPVLPVCRKRVAIPDKTEQEKQHNHLFTGQTASSTYYLDMPSNSFKITQL